MGIWIILGVVALLLVGFLLLCRKTGTQFMQNLRRRKPGEPFNPNIDISFYTKGPLCKKAKEGMAFMETLPYEDVYITSEDGLKLHGILFPAEEHPKKIVLGVHGFQSHARNEFGPHIAFYRPS